MTLNDYLVGIRWHDVIVVGAGHNGLVAALFFAKAGLKVLVLEARESIGGTFATERPFASCPELGVSTGADVLGLVPPGLMAKMGVELPTLRRDPLGFFPAQTASAGFVAFGARAADDRAQIAKAFSESDARATDGMLDEIAQIGADLGTAWLDAPVTLEQTAETFVRPALRDAFVALCRDPATRAFDRWGIASEHLRALLSTGLDVHAAGSGASLLVQTLARLADAAGGYVAVRGGMGTASHMIADEAIRHGAVIETESKVGSIVVEGGVTKGVVLTNGQMQHARAVVCGADPAHMSEMLGHSRLPPPYVTQVDGYRADSATLKVCLALKGLPRLACAPGAFEGERFAPAIHLLPESGPPIEWHVASAIDPALRDPDGHHSATLIVRGVPYALQGTTWDAEESAYVKRLLSICDRFAPGTSDLVLDTFVLTPPKLEKHFGVARGQLHPVDDRFAFAARLPCATPVAGLYSCSGATAPLGGIVGAAGHNAAMRVLADLGR